jgi:hypothetical protein
MGSMGSTSSARAQKMRRVLAQWQRSGLRLREFGEQRGIPLSTLRWWRRVFRAAGAAAPAVEFTEVLAPVSVPRPPAGLEIVLASGHLIRVPTGADRATLEQVLEILQTRC